MPLQRASMLSPARSSADLISRRLSKKATNWSIAASNWRAQAPATLSNLQSSLQPPVSLRAENLSTLGAKWSKAGAEILRPPSPPDAPFSPPSESSNGSESPAWKRSSLLETPNGGTMMRKASSNGPKPLLLSSSARPAREGSENGDSPHQSRRSSWYADSPVGQTRSVSPSPPTAHPSSGIPSAFKDRKLSDPDRPIPILGRANSPAAVRSLASPKVTRHTGLNGKGFPLAASTRYGPNRRHTSAQSDVTPLSSVETAPPPLSAIERPTAPMSAVTPRRGWTLRDAPASPPSPEPEEPTPPRSDDDRSASGGEGFVDASSTTPPTRSGSWKLSHQRDESSASQASAHADDYEPRGPPAFDATAVPVPPVPTGPRKPRTSSLAKLNLASLDGRPATPPKTIDTQSPGKSDKPKGLRKLYKRLSSSSVLQEAAMLREKEREREKEPTSARTSSDETLVEDRRRSGGGNRDSTGSAWDEDELLASYHAATTSLGVN